MVPVGDTGAAVSDMNKVEEVLVKTKILASEALERKV
jgi:hypothetical protein